MHGCSTLIASPLPSPTEVIMWWKVMLSNGPASQPAGRPHTLGRLATRNAEPVATATEMTLRSLSGQTNSGLWRPGQGGARAMARARLCRQSNTRHATNRYFGQCQSTQSMLVVLALSPWRWWNGERVTSPSITPPYRALLQAGRPLDIVVLP